MKSWTDKEFINYVELHSKTPRALFSPQHVNRFMELIGSGYRAIGFETMRYKDIKIPLARAIKYIEEKNS
jgi:hypothetical protein